MSDWEIVTETKWENTKRLKVDGGYLYRIVNNYGEGENESIAMTWVPDIDLTRYQAHLRDAYKKGFDDGREDGIIEGVHRGTGAA